ncbi:MAG: AMP-binding protein, partial [Acidobacteria bacterium]|nr:AMP-binding protein [Acidobacteriota bacterium]
LPIVTKTMLRDRFPAKETRERFGIEGKVNATGGSTGEPTQFVHDTLMLKSALAANMYTRFRMGWRPGMATIIIWGSERDIGRQTNWRVRVNGKLLQEYLVDGYHLSEATAERVLGIMRARRPVAMYGFTSMLEFVARFALEKGHCPAADSVHAAWTGGEMLFPEQAAIFQQAFGVPLFNRYGGRELSAMACQFEASGPLHVLRPWLFLEVVDENGKPVGPGEPGRLVWTSTICRGTPFLRYDVEDVGVFDATHQLESGISALHELQGRVAGLMKLPDGRTINNLYWNHLFKEFPEARQFQVVYRRNGEIWISLVGNGMSESRERELRDMIGHLLSDVPITILWVKQIPRTAQGKLIQVIRES